MKGASSERFPPAVFGQKKSERGTTQPRASPKLRGFVGAERNSAALLFREIRKNPAKNANFARVECVAAYAPLAGSESEWRLAKFGT